MSVYQNTYFIVPKEGKHELVEGMNLGSFMNDGLFQDDLFWEDNTLEYKSIDNYLTNKNIDKGKSWSKKLKIFGDIDENCIKLFIENNKVISINFRVNFATDFKVFLKSTIEFCIFFKLLIVDNELNVLPLDYATIIDNTFNSKAHNRCKNFFDM